MQVVTKQEALIGVALVLSTAASCQKRQVGCVLVDDDNRIIGTGYNGRPRGMYNCDSEHPCVDSCEGVHAEINALLQADPQKIRTAYVTHAPCWHCVKALINTSCSSILFLDASTEEDRARDLWRKAGGLWTQLHIDLLTGGVS